MSSLSLSLVSTECITSAKTLSRKSSNTEIPSLKIVLSICKHGSSLFISLTIPEQLMAELQSGLAEGNSTDLILFQNPASKKHDKGLEYVMIRLCH